MRKSLSSAAFAAATLMVVISGCALSGPVNNGAVPGAAEKLEACTAQTGPLAVGQSNESIPAVPRPAKGQVFRDPTYRSCLIRVTDHALEPPSGFARNDYSRRQAFNADNSMFLVYAVNGYWHLYSAVDFSHQGQLLGPVADAEPQWHPTDPNRLLYLPINGVGMTIREMNVQTGASRFVMELEDRLTERWPSANAAWTRSEGATSADARYMALLVEDSDFQSVGMVVVDLAEDKILAYKDVTERPDHLSISPSGNYVVVSWLDRVMVYDRDLSNERQIGKRTEHSDIAIGANGHDIFVSIDYQANDGDIYMVDLVTGERTDLLPTYLNGTATAMHFSGKGYDKPGWVIVSTYANTSEKQEWLHDKIFAMELKKNPRIVPLAHHRSIEKGYWTEPHASVSRDFSRVLFTSNWNKPDAQDVDAYLLTIAPDALPSD